MSGIQGDERVGSHVCVYLSKYLLENFNKDANIQFLLQNRVILLMPMANAHGYYNNKRVGEAIKRKKKYMKPFFIHILKYNISLKRKNIRLIQIKP